MSRLLVGSAACESILGRRPKDEDWIATDDEVLGLTAGARSVEPINGTKYIARMGNGRMREIEVAWPGSTGEELLDLAYANGLTNCGESATPGVCLALKLSHRFKASPHFRKTMRDIQMLRGAGVTVPPCLTDWLKRRERETLAYHQHPKLNQNSAGFFRPEEVPYVYVHDTIHLAMAAGEAPAYTYFQADGAEVKVDRTKWEALDEHIKLNSVLEESYVLALERHQIPNNFTPDPKRSFSIALEKVCTTIASGWWREWAWEHYDAALAAFDAGYVTRFHDALARGVVKPYLTTEHSVA